MSIGVIETAGLQIVEKLTAFPEAKRAEILKKVRDQLGVGKLHFRAFRRKPEAELTGRDIPPGLDVEDVALEYAPEGEDTSIAADEVMEILQQRDVEILDGVASLFAVALEL